MRNFFIKEPIQAQPTPDRNTIIYRAQSLLTKEGKIGPLLSYEEACLVLQNQTARVS